MQTPLRASIALSIMAALFSTIGVLGIGILRGELADRDLLADAHRVQAEVVAVGSSGATVEYRIDGHQHRARLDDRATQPRNIGDPVAIEVPRAQPGRAVHRVGSADFSLPAILITIGLGLGIGCSIAAWRLRRRCALLPSARLPGWRRAVAASIDLAVAMSFLVLWIAPQQLPAAIGVQASNALRFEALLLVLMSFAAPLLLEPRHMLRAALFAVALTVAGALLANFMAQGEGDWTWSLLAILLVTRGWPLFEPDTARRLHLAERWSAALGALLGTWWLCFGVLAWLPLPATDESVGLPSAATLLWGMSHFSLQALMQWFDWPRPRADAPAPAAASVAARAMR